MTCETETLPRTLTQMHHRLTAYEVVVRCDGGTETRLGFSERRTKSALLAIAQQHCEAIMAMLGSWDGDASYAKATGWTFGPVRICFSGQTERDCASHMDRI